MKFNAAKDYYAILGVSRNATSTEIHLGYKKMVSRYHPDKHQGNELEDLAREKLVQVNEAHDVLSKSERRAAYDAARVFSKQSDSSRSPAESTPRHSGSLRKWIQLIVIMVGTPFLLRFVRSPRIALVIGGAIMVAWFAPKLLKRLKK